jgi:DNA-binding transcriptional regulator YdaS (Cro superfamily)
MTLKDFFETKKLGAKTEMAKALGISRTWLALIINGQRVPSVRLSLDIERYTHGKVRRKDLRPDMFGAIK